MSVYTSDIQFRSEVRQTPRSSASVQLVRARGHDEVVAVKSANRVSPPVDGDPAPLGDDTRVVVNRLGGLRYSRGELRRSGEIGEPESFSEP